MEKKILLVDDHSIVRQGLSLLIKNNISYCSVFQANSIAKALDIYNSEKIDFLILDINLSDGEGVFSIQKFKHLNKNIKILMFSALDEELYGLRYLQAGANGYLSKAVNDQELIRAIIRFTEVGEYISNNLKNIAFDNLVTKKYANPINILTDREIEIARFLVRGISNQEITKKLGLKKSTISTYKNRIFEKLNITNLASLIEIFNLYEESC